MPDSALFPTDAFRRVLNQVIREEGESLLQYSVGRRLHAAAALSGRLPAALRRGGPAEEILIVNGSQQGFDLIARTLVDPGDVVAIEQPTYARAMQAFRSFGARLLPVEWDASRAAARRVRAAVRAAGAQDVLLPAERPQSERTRHGARGRTALAGRRRPLPGARSSRTASTAASTTARGRALPLKAADRAGVVIYIGTFSKILFPGLRLGWLVAPPRDRRASAGRQAAGRSAQQRAAAGGRAPVLRASAARPPHQPRGDREYGRRRALLLASLRRRMPEGVTWTEPQGGFSLLLTLPAGLEATALLPLAIERGVAFSPGPAFFLDGAGERTLRLAFSSVSGGRIDEGVRRLAEAIKAARRQPRAATHGSRAGSRCLISLSDPKRGSHGRAERTETRRSQAHRPGRDAQGRRHHGRHQRRAGEDRRGRGRGLGDGAGARALGHPARRRRGAHVAGEEDPGDPEGGDHPRDGQGPDRPLRRGADPGGARRGLHRRVRGAHAGRRALPHRQVRVPDPVRVRVPRSRRGAAAHRRGRGDDPHQGRGGLRQHRRGRAPHARGGVRRASGSPRSAPRS